MFIVEDLTIIIRLGLSTRPIPSHNLQVMKTPPASYFIKKAASIESGSKKPGHEKVATIGLKKLYAIAEVKQKDTPFVPLESVCRSLVGSCRSMGVQVVADRSVTS